MRISAKSSKPVAAPRSRRAQLFPLGNVDPFTPSAEQPVRVRSRAMPTDAHFEPHAHPWAQLAYCASGVLQVAVSQADQHTTYLVPPSRAVWIPPGAQHSIHVLEAAQLRTLYLDASSTPSGWQSARVLQVKPLLRELVAALHDLIGNIDSPRGQHLSQLILDELRQAPTQTLGIPMPAGEGSERQADRRLRALCEALLRNPQSHRDLADWAASVGASERTLHRLFRKELGMGFSQWRQQVLIAQALPLLARGDNVAQVAAVTGYQSVSAFSSMFKAAMGQSPSDIARS